MGCLLVVDGFDGQRAGNPEVQGLPLDGMLGVNRLGDYDQPNSIQLGGQTENSRQA